MWSFLSSNGLASSTLSVFREQLHTLWFGLYSRGGKGDLGSSGFEHVFVGEYENSDVEGQHYWVQFYELEKIGQINYHGWFDRQKDVQISMQYAWNTHQKMLGGFLIGTSPEFDFSLFTLCTLAKPGAHACPFMLDTYNADVTSYQDTTTNAVKVATAYTTTTTGGSAPGSTTTGKPNADGLGDLVNAMRAADVGKAQPGDIVLNWGNHVKGTTDVSPQPFFTHVNENLFNRQTYNVLHQILDRNLFDPQVCDVESTNGLKTGLEQQFIN
uniref:Endoribonuclease n=1 Tax=Plectus sambesii TaxID=2011161 RepID=A0A914VC91_9BILA